MLNFVAQQLINIIKTETGGNIGINVLDGDNNGIVFESERFLYCWELGVDLNYNSFILRTVLIEGDKQLFDTTEKYCTIGLAIQKIIRIINSTLNH